ncbi:conserved hypothetical protein [Neospora caninum Liverpool]|uniref:Transmembrane protein n=1 Tax=Neospora caninum (strain Liverpool) TaxID=572307 RepID=F0VKD7_NEOCL|nr:conserved hypothetical protein [Neospora caninum Liverpool]CBZ54538.1 conserved hypothetical protein [Neospora caninum Liverpool]CEL69251.1 TPA: hypothetical protein BN1204_049670 [Neospora caninum Liverpool]|eukprot:XP_003884568.1 conserved hypothetical protein [Neospora caninum Liverpool]
MRGLRHGLSGTSKKHRAGSLFPLLSPEPPATLSPARFSSPFLSGSVPSRSSRSSVSPLLSSSPPSPCFRRRRLSLHFLTALVIFVLSLLSSPSLLRVAENCLAWPAGAPVSSSVLLFPAAFVSLNASLAARGIGTAPPSPLLFAAASSEDASPAVSPHHAPRARGTARKRAQRFAGLSAGLRNGLSDKRQADAGEEWPSQTSAPLAGSDDKPKPGAWLEGFLSWVAASRGLVEEEDYESESFVLSLTLVCNTMPTAFRRLYSHLPAGITAADVLESLIVGAPWLGGAGGSLLHLKVCVADHRSYRLTAYRGCGTGPPLSGAALTTPLSQFLASPSEQSPCSDAAAASAASPAPQKEPCLQGRPEASPATSTRSLHASAGSGEGTSTGVSRGTAAVLEKLEALMRPERPRGLRAHGPSDSASSEDPADAASCSETGAHVVRGRQLHAWPDGAEPVRAFFDTIGKRPQARSGSGKKGPSAAAEEAGPRATVSLVVAVDAALTNEELQALKPDAPALAKKTEKHVGPVAQAGARGAEPSVSASQRDGSSDEGSTRASREGPVKGSELVVRVQPGSRPAIRKSEPTKSPGQLTKEAAAKWRRKMLETMRKRSEEAPAPLDPNAGIGQSGGMDLQSSIVEQATTADEHPHLKAFFAGLEGGEAVADSGKTAPPEVRKSGSAKPERHWFFRWLFGEEEERAENAAE